MCGVFSEASITEPIDAVVDPEIESSNALEAGESPLEQTTTPESDVVAASVSEGGRSELNAERARTTVADRFKLNQSERQTTRASISRIESTAEQAVAAGSERQNNTAEAPSRPTDRWQSLRQQAALAARQIAASGAANHLSAFHQTGVIPATTGSLAMDWGATIAAFAHSALEDQLQGLTTEADNEFPEDSTQQMTYAQAASATGTVLIGVTAAFQALHKRQRNKLQRHLVPQGVIGGS